MPPMLPSPAYRGSDRQPPAVYRIGFGSRHPRDPILYLTSITITHGREARDSEKSLRFSSGFLFPPRAWRWYIALAARDDQCIVLVCCGVSLSRRLPLLLAVHRREILRLDSRRAHRRAAHNGRASSDLALILSATFPAISARTLVVRAWRSSFFLLGHRAGIAASCSRPVQTCCPVRVVSPRRKSLVNAKRMIGRGIAALSRSSRIMTSSSPFSASSSSTRSRQSVGLSPSRHIPCTAMGWCETSARARWWSYDHGSVARRRSRRGPMGSQCTWSSGFTCSVHSWLVVMIYGFVAAVLPVLLLLARAHLRCS